jgi:hypothetical protein
LLVARYPLTLLTKATELGAAVGQGDFGVSVRVPLLAREQVEQLPIRAREIVEYRKSGLSLNHIQGCPLDCAYCIRHPDSNQAEVDFYREATECLIRAGYRVLPLNVSDKPPDLAAAVIAERRMMLLAIRRV